MESVYVFITSFLENLISWCLAFCHKRQNVGNIKKPIETLHGIKALKSERYFFQHISYCY